MILRVVAIIQGHMSSSRLGKPGRYRPADLEPSLRLRGAGAVLHEVAFVAAGDALTGGKS